VQQQFAQLDPENAAAFACYQRHVTRFAVATGTLGIPLQRITRDMEDDEAVEFYERLAVLYDVFVPVRKPGDGA
jgi:hypothetical protein